MSLHASQVFMAPSGPRKDMNYCDEYDVHQQNLLTFCSEPAKSHPGSILMECSEKVLSGVFVLG